MSGGLASGPWYGKTELRPYQTCLLDSRAEKGSMDLKGATPNLSYQSTGTPVLMDGMPGEAPSGFGGSWNTSVLVRWSGPDAIMNNVSPIEGNNRMKSAPVVLDSVNDIGRSLGRIDARPREQRDEAWVQRLIFEHPEILPVNEFDETYCPLVAVGREIETASGFVDNLYVSPSGAITIVETKLWQNPEKHRTVVAQVIDYAKEISRWTYDDLNAAVLKASRQGADTHKQSLDDLIQPHLASFGLGLSDFQERTIRTLNNGEFLLLIVGDRISANLALLTESISGAPGLDFRLGLIELQIYSMADNQDWPIVVIPDIVGRTVEKTRGVIRIQYVQERPNVEVTVEDAEPTQQGKGKTTREVFLSKAPDDLAPVYEQWLSIWPSKGMVVYWGVTGFSLRLRVNGRLQTLLDAYPEWAVSLVRESDAKRLDISGDSYRRYIEAITGLPEATGILGAGKKYMKQYALTADTMMLLLSATTELGLSPEQVDEKSGLTGK